LDTKWIYPKPNCINKHFTKEQSRTGQRTARLTPPKYRAVFGGAVSFYVMVFVSQHTCSTFIFLKGREKNKRAAPTTLTKTHAIKNCPKLH
jgi:hypothetical protein